MRKLWRKVVKVVAGVLAALVVGAVLTQVIVGAIATTKLRRTQKAIAARGLPTTIAELVPPPVAAADNAEPLLRQAFASVGETAMRRSGVSKAARALEKWVPSLAAQGDLEASTQDLRLASAEVKAELRAHLAHPELGKVFAWVEAAAARPASRYELDYVRGAETPMPHLGRLYTCAKLLAVRAALRADEGNAAGALNDLRVLFALCRELENEPVQISQLTNIAVVAIGAGSLNLVLDHDPGTAPPAAVAEALAALLGERAARLRPAVVRALDGERVIVGDWSFESFLRSSRPGPNMVQRLSRAGAPWARWYGTYPLRPLVRLDHRCYLERIVAVRDRVAAAPTPATLAPAAAPPIPRHCPISRTTMVVLDRAPVQVTSGETFLTLARLGLALAEYRREHGSYPDALEALKAPANLLLDAFSGKPLVYRRQGEGYRLYSVGENGVDDGGDNKLVGNAHLDLVWAIIR